jgi:hypothetical protein
MSLRTLGFLQWAGLLAGVATFVAAHSLGFSITQAECNVPGDRRGIHNDAWMIAISAAAGVVIIASAVAAAIVFARTRGADPGDGPVDERGPGPAEPSGRLHFFSAAALTANLIFLCIVALNGAGSVFNVTCIQS